MTLNVSPSWKIDALLIQLGGNRFRSFLAVSQNSCDLFFPFGYRVL